MFDEVPDLGPDMEPEDELFWEYGLMLMEEEEPQVAHQLYKEGLISYEEYQERLAATRRNQNRQEESPGQVILGILVFVAIVIFAILSA